MNEPDYAARAAVKVAETLERWVHQGYTIQLREIDNMVFLFAISPVRADMSGHGKSIEQAIDMILQEK